MRKISFNYYYDSDANISYEETKIYEASYNHIIVDNLNNYDILQLTKEKHIY
jgi:hypothetical protein